MSSSGYTSWATYYGDIMQSLSFCRSEMLKETDCKIKTKHNTLALSLFGGGAVFKMLPSIFSVQLQLSCAE